MKNDDIDERTCPACGHEVLGWEVPCAGCDQIPWDTPQGQRVIKRRRASLEASDPMTWIKYFILIVVLLSFVGQIQFCRRTSAMTERPSQDQREMLGFPQQ